MLDAIEGMHPALAIVHSRLKEQLQNGLAFPFYSQGGRKLWQPPE